MYVLELLGKCLSGLSVGEQLLPADVVERTFVALQPLLARMKPPNDNIIPLLAALAYPEFVEAGRDVERLLDQDLDVAVPRQVLETLIGMRSPRLGDVLIRLSRSSSRPEMSQFASRYLAEAVDNGDLLRLPNDLRHILYSAATLRNVRFQREGFRHKVVFANGQRDWV